MSMPGRMLYGGFHKRWPQVSTPTCESLGSETSTRGPPMCGNPQIAIQTGPGLTLKDLGVVGSRAQTLGFGVYG